MDEALIPTLSAVMDRIIPADDFSSASENGVLQFFQQQWETAIADRQHLLTQGLIHLEEESRARYGSSFRELSPTDQDALLGEIEHARTATVWTVPAAQFFREMVHLTSEGYYADPSNGGNVTMASWKMVGFKP